MLSSSEFDDAGTSTYDGLSVDENSAMAQEDNNANLFYNIVATTYHEVWRDFYAWEQVFCAQRISEAAAATEIQLQAGGMDYAFEDLPDVEAMEIDTTDLVVVGSKDVFTICRWDKEGQLSKTTCSTLSAVQDCRESGGDNAVFRDHPKYESCTPTNAYINSNEEEVTAACSFIKFEECLTFSPREYLETFYAVQWQEDGRDPDRTYLDIQLNS